MRSAPDGLAGEPLPLVVGQVGRARLLLGWAALLLLSALATYFVADPLRYVAMAAIRGGAPLSSLPPLLIGAIGPAQWLLIALLPAMLLTALLVEWRAAPLSWLLTAAEERVVLLALLVAAGWFAHSYWVPGYLLAGDSGEHVARFAHVMQAAREQTVILWDPTAYEGSPFLQFTGPLLFWLGGGAALLTGDPTLGTKSLLFVLHIASGLGFFGFMRALGLRSGAAFLAALAYVGAFAHLHTILFRGEFPQALVLALLPALFWSAERIAARPRIGDGAWLALAATLAGFLYAHQTTAFYAGLYVALYILVRGNLLRSLPALGSAVALGLTMALPAILPILMEEDGVVVGRDLWQPWLDWPGLAYFDHLLIWRNSATSHGSDSSAYVGLSTLLLVLAALARWPRRWPRGLCYALLALPLSVLVQGHFIRDMMFTLFLLCWLAAYGAERLLVGWRWRHAPAALALLLMLDLGPTAIQPQARTDKAYLDAAGAYLAAAAPDQRVASMSLEGDRLVPDIGPSATPLFYHPVPALHGPHNSTATLAHNYLAAIAWRAAEDLNRNGHLSPASATLLGWLDVRRVIATGRTAMGLPAAIAGTRNEGPLGRTLAIADASPVRAAAALATLDPDAGLDRPMVWLDDMQQGLPQLDLLEGFLDRVLSTGGAIPVRGPVAVAAQQPGPTPQLALRFYRLGWNRTNLVLESDAPGYVQLAHAFYPALAVHINGAPVAALQGSFGLLVLPIAAGRSEIEISLPLTAARRGSAMLALAGMALAALAYAWRRRRENKGGGRG